MRRRSRRATPAVDADEKTIVQCEQYQASRLLSRRSRRENNTQPSHPWDESFTGHIAAAAEDDEKLLDFDSVYSDVLGERGSDKSKQLLEALGITTAHIATIEAVRSLVRRLMRSAYNRTLRFIGRDLAGRMSRTLVGLGLRVTTASVTSHVFARFSTRIMLALGSTASGVGVVIELVEIVGALLDFMLMFGWDPGNYNSEFTNAVYDDLAIGWLRQRRYYDMTDMDPYVMLSIFQRDREGALVSEGGGGGDSSMEPRGSSDDESRLAIRSKKQVPWFFEPFAAATRAMIADATGDSGGGGSSSENDDDRLLDYSDMMLRRRKVTLSAASTAGEDRSGDPLLRARPIVTENAVTTSLLLSMHYFRQRQTNSLGQQVNVTSDDILITDEVVSQAVRDNELATFLSSAYSANEVPRDLLLGAARRNIVDKTTTCGIALLLVAGCTLTLAVSGCCPMMRNVRNAECAE